MPQSKFVEKYHTDSTFREKHLNYMSQKVTCSCSPHKSTARCNMSKHRKTRIHQQWVEKQILAEKLREIEMILKKINK
jgi:hypothetical protein